MTAPAKKKTRSKSTGRNVKSKTASGTADRSKVGKGRKKKRKTPAKAATSNSFVVSSTAKTKRKRGRSTSKKMSKKKATKNSLQGSFSSLDSTKSTNSGRSQDAFNRLGPSSNSDIRALSQESAISGQRRALGFGAVGKRSRSATGVEHSGRFSARPLDKARQGRSSSLIRSRSIPNLFHQNSNNSLGAGTRPPTRTLSNPNIFRQNSNQSLGGGGGGGIRPRSLQRARSTNRGESPSSFTQRRINRLGSRMKRAGSASGLSRQSSKSSMFESSDDEGGSRSRSKSRRILGNSDDLEKIISMIESGNDPDVGARTKSPSRYEKWAQRNRVVSRSPDASTASLVDEVLPEDTIWTSGLRYIRILSPNPNECRSDKIIRFLTWGAMILDFIAALVSIFTYESVTMCCGKPIFELLDSNINWNEFVRIFTYIYLVLIFLEVVPVFNKELPLNLINPLIGFTITMAMFFDDRIGEAVTLWTIEALAIAFETVITWLRRKQHLRHIDRIAECDVELAVREGKRRRRGNSADSEDPYSDLESLSGGSFYNSSDAEVNRFRIERERRQLMAGLKEEEITMRYHFIGSAINVSLVLISLILIIGIGKNGGLCISNFEAPPIFKDDQLERCPACVGATGTCEVCDATGGNQHQCYYPYVL